MEEYRNNFKNRSRFPLRTLLPLGIAIVISVTLSALRVTLFPEPMRWHTQIGMTLVVVLAMLAGANVIFHRCYEKRSGTKTLLKFRAELLKRQDSMAHSFARQTRRMSALLRFAYYYYIAVMAMVCCVIYCLFDGINEFAVMVYVLWGMLEMLFDLEPQELPSQELAKEDYPLLYETAQKAADIAGYHGKIRIFLGDISIGIFSIGGTENLILGIPETLLLTREELTQVLIHEFSHVVQEDTVRSRQIARELETWNAEKASSLTRWGTVFLWIPQDILRREFAYYQSLSNIYRELLADAAVVKLGDPQQHINALSKCYAWQLFTQAPHRELIYDLFEPESPREDYYCYLLHVFEDYLHREEPHIRSIFAREIPLKFDSHPIFRIRAENAGIQSYQLCTREEDPGYRAEIHRLLNLCNRLILEDSSPEDYLIDRQENFLDRRAVMETLAAVPNLEDIPISRRLSYAAALANVEPELQKALLESILRQEPENSSAVWLLAQALFYEDDERCIELLYTSVRLNKDYIQMAYTLIGNFALQSGRQDLRDAYGERMVELFRTLDVGAICLTEPLSENDLPAEDFREVRDAIFRRGGSDLVHLYSLKKKTLNGPNYFYFLEFSIYSQRKTRERIYDDVFLYLDQREEHFSLFALKRKMKRTILQKVPNCEVVRF